MVLWILQKQEGIIRIYFSVVIVTAISLSACTSIPKPAGMWTCRNNDAEIGCEGKSCAVTLPPNFTPMSLTVNTDGSLSLCAYSGCWAGKAGKVTRSGQFLTFTGHSLVWSGTGGGSADVAATVNTQTGVATVLAEGYAQPMTCRTN